MSYKKSKLTLLVDGNWLLMSRLSVMQNRFASVDDLVKDLKIMMVRSINVMLRTFPSIDNVIFVADGGSWRNSIEIPNFLQNEGIKYKGNREKDPNIDWDKIFGAYEDFIALLKDCGITVAKEKGIEGDDWCWYWSNKLNAHDTNVIIWSADKDLTQLVKIYKDTKIFTICWNKNQMVTMDLGDIAKADDDLDLMFLFNADIAANESLYNGIASKSKKIVKIHPMDVVIDKIIRGDAGDNVMPILTKTKNTRTYKVTTKDIDFDLDFTSIDSVEKYLHNLMESKSWKGKTPKSYNEVLQHFIYNRQLVWLNSKSYPKEVITKMFQHKIDTPNKDFSIVESKLLAEKNGQENVFDEI